jgi:hypothetical protein
MESSMTPSASAESALHCRLCHAAVTQVFVDLGKSPLSNAYLKKEQLGQMEPFYPLCAYVCERCLLVQLPAVEKRESIFKDDYAYFSSFSDSLLKHSEAYANMMIPRFGLGKTSLVVEVASNDGYLLQYFKRAGVPVLGVEPSGGVARAAIEQKGVPTVVRFMGVETGRDLRAQRDYAKGADLIIGNNVLAHVPDLHDFLGGMKALLGEKGVITVEFPHLMQLMHEAEFDTIYHEHFSYFSFATARKAFEANGFRVFDVDEIATHGGSFRVYACHAADSSKVVSDNVRAVERREAAAGLETLATYTGFSEKVNTVKRDLLSFLIQAKQSGKKVIGYGAPAKANTLFNYCGIRRDFVDFTADRSPHKQGMYLPGSHVPILAPSAIETARPDYILILPWNLKTEIMTQLAYTQAWGARFVVAIPRLQLLG